MQFFLGIDIPDPVKLQLSQQLQEFVKEYPYLSYTPVDNYHVTIQHFGDHNSPEKLHALLDQTLYDIPAFELYTLGAGLFINHQIVLYVSFARKKLLEEIVKRVQQTTDIQSMKTYVPHLTFAKYKVPSKQQYLLIKKKLSNLNLDITIPVDKLYLFESISKGKQVSYQKVKEYPLLKEE